ncbi:T9SS type A sorting domain-containing protein [candidate division KSB1 bacterium]|nr:T9SS type A sorting domain-containing protein [candidate division KSB1 bacterium]
MKRRFVLFLAVVAVLLTAAASAETVTLSVASGTGKLGSDENVLSIRLQNAVPVGGIQLRMADIPDFLVPDSVVMTARTEKFVASYSDTLGFMTILLWSMSRSLIEAGEGEVLKIYCRIPESARPETVTITIFQDDLIVVDGSNNRLPVQVENGNFIITSVSQPSSVPGCYSLRQNYPNPFNPTTFIPFSLARDGEIRMEIFNTLGQRVALLADGFLTAGEHSVVWNGRDQYGHVLPGGNYFYRLQAGDFTETRSLLLLK